MSRQSFILIGAIFPALISILPPAIAQGVITTVAGNGSQNFSGDGGLATSAGLGSPFGIVLDSAGNFYVADQGDNRVRKVTPAGIISTVAGNGVNGFSGDGGPATSAALNSPCDLAMDTAGNLYIADSGNNRIRKVTQAGVISTVAGNGTAGFSGDGGPATSASLNDPFGVAVDASQNLYIADSGNFRIRKVTPSGVISTVAGNGQNSFSGDGGPATSAALSFPAAVAVDAGGNLYVADYGNNRIRKVTPNGSISTVAGNGVNSFSGDGGPATAAALSDPSAVALDSAGNLYVAATGNERIRKVTAGGTISTVAGNNLIGFSGDGGPATGADLNLPAGVAVDAAGNIYIADTANNRVRKVTASAGQLSVSPQSLSFTAIAGGAAPAAQQLQISSSGTGALSFSVTATTASGGNWLSVSPFSGTTPATLSVTVSAAALTAGTYQGAISVAGGGATVQVAVTLTVTSASAPSIASIVNGYSYVGGPIAPGELVSLYGQNLGPAAAVSSNATPGPTTLAGTQVLFGGAAVEVLLTSAGQVNVIAPFGLAAGANVQVVVSYQGALSTPVAASVAASAPGVSTASPGQATAFHAASDALVTPANPAAIGEIVLVYFTGGGQTTPAQTNDGQLSTAPLAQPTTVTVSGIPAPVQFAGTVGTPGFDQVNFTVPAGVPAGNAAVVVTIGGVSSQSGVTMAVGASAVTPASIQIVSGNNQSGAVGSTLAAPLTIEVTGSDGNPFAGAAVVFAVTGGSATLFSGGTTTGSNGMASAIVTLGNTAGAVTVTASVGTLKATFTLTATAAPATTTTLTSSPNPSGTVQNVTLTATVSPSTATGSVTFRDGSFSLGTSTLSGGIASLVVPTLSIGTHSLTAVYLGDVNDAPSTSAAVIQTVSSLATTTTLTSSANPSVLGQSVTLTATVTPSGVGLPGGIVPITLYPVGTVTFMDGSNTLGSATLSGLTAALTVSTFSIGTHALTAVFGGSAYDAASSSAIFNQTVNATPTTTTLTSSSNTPTAGQAVTLIATVTPATATGVVAFIDGSNPLGSSPLNGGTATLAWTPISAGPQSLTAVYGGDANDAPSTSAALNETVSGLAPLLVATPATLSLVYIQGSPVPLVETLGISSNTAQLPFSVNASTASGGQWLFAGLNSGTSPALFNVLILPSGLSPNTYNGTLTISSQNATSVVVNVSLTVVAPAPSLPPELSVNAPPLTLTGQQGGPTVSAQLQVSNVGGGVLSFTAAATTSSGTGWLSISPSGGMIDNTAGPGAPVSVTVTCDPGSLTPGTYQGSITVSGAGATVPPIPVTFSVAPPTPSILVSQAGLSFTAASQGGAPLPQPLGILNIGSGMLNWTATASTLSGNAWLLISAASGTVEQPYLDVSPLNVSIDPNVLATLTPGDYYGQIQIADSSAPSPQAAVNSPQLVTVILSVLAPGIDPGPQISPSSLIFTGLPGASPASQNVAIGIRKAVNDQYTAISEDLNASLAQVNGFTFTPATSPVQPNNPVNLQVLPNFAPLSPGEIDHGTILLQFSDGTARTIGLLTVVAPTGTGDLRLGPKATASCTNLNLQWRTPTPPNFTVAQGHGQTLELQVVDDCGNLIGPNNPKSASVTATFSNGDTTLPLVHVGNGVWTGTWKPVNLSSGPVTVVIGAFNEDGLELQSGQSNPVYGTVVPGTNPVVTAGGVQHGASLVLGVPIAPGTLITLKGSNLADPNSQGSGPGNDDTQPLPTQWNGTQVFLGTEALPLLYSATGQVNVQIPYDVPVDTQFQIAVQVDSSTQSLPVQLVIAEAQPGVFTVDASGIGQGVIFKADGVTLAQPGTPATVGETITILCTGLGAVDPAVPAGMPPPSSPLSMVVDPIAVTIGGQSATVISGNLAPGQPGVYQVSALVPSGVSGDGQTVTVTVAGQTSPPVTMSVQ